MRRRCARDVRRVLAYFPLLIPAHSDRIPILDSFLAIVRRARKRRSVFHADKEHIHHRLMDLGHGHRPRARDVRVVRARRRRRLAFTFSTAPT